MPRHSRTKKPITQSWTHYKLKRFFAASTERSITLTFQQLEEIAEEDDEDWDDDWDEDDEEGVEFIYKR